jgi:hypothetical protein
MLPEVEQSKNFLPNWFKGLKPTIPRTKVHDSIFYEDVLTVKKCIPFLESMSAGYTIPLWSDLKVEKLPTLIFRSHDGQILNQQEVFLRKSESPKDFIGKVLSGHIIDAVEVGDVKFNLYHPSLANIKIETHLKSQVGLEGRFKHVDQIFKLLSPWSVKTSKGYSCFFKNPSNDFSSPITLFEGIVDTDNYGNPISFPCFVSDLNVEECIIKAGTPICQVFPFKRESYELTVSYSVSQEAPHNTFFSFSDYYRKNNWHRRKRGKDLDT